MLEHFVDDNNFYSIVGNRIRVARKEKNIDQESLAKCVQLTRTSIINIEKGRQRPSIHQIWQMAQYLNISVLDLIPPLDIKIRIDDWTERVKSSPIVSDKDTEKVLGFISVTRNTK